MDKNQQDVISEQAFKAVIDNVGAFIYIKDLDGRYLYVNQQVQELFGVPMNAIIGQTDDAFFDLNISNQLRENDLKVIQEGETQTCEEHNFVRELNAIRIYWSVKKPLFNDIGDIIGMYGISTDITERKSLERQLQEQNDFLNIVMNNIGSSIYMVDQQHRVRYGNRRLAERFGLAESELTNIAIADIVDAETSKLICDNNDKVFASGKAERFKERIVSAKGQEQVFWSVKVPHQLASGEKMLIGFSTEMTEVFELQEKLRKQSSQDELTELYNRRYFFNEGEKQLITAKHDQVPSCLLVIDLDYFKDINDEYGHPIGDLVLQAVAERLRDKVRKTDLLARVGGEEFALFLPDTTADKASELAEKLCKSISEREINVENGKKITVTISIGVQCDSNSSKSFAENYRLADKLLYDAKNNGRNQVCKG